MQLREMLIRGTGILEGCESETPGLDARILGLELLGKDRTFLIMEPDAEIGTDVEREYFKRIEQRALGKPVSYIIGKKEFMGFEFNVNENVLIPRPDTETLVEEAVRILKKTGGRGNPDGKPLKVMDICTGSGAIGISIAKLVPGTEVRASDISEKALEVAVSNAEKLMGEGPDRISFRRGDLFEAFDSDDGKYDMITANPPYISEEEMKTLMRDVREYEPELALCGGEDGLELYRRIVPGAAERLREGGVLLMEIGCGQGSEVSGMMEASGLFGNIRVIKDLAGLDRVVSGIKNKKECGKEEGI